jgi:chemotaxis protein MotA
LANRGSRLKFDFATALGLLLAFIGIIGGLLAENGELNDVLQATAALIVFGGTLGAVMVTTSMQRLKQAGRRVIELFLYSKPDPKVMMEDIIGYATQARRHGVVSLEDEADQIEDPFLRKSLNLAVDGTSTSEIRRMMELEIALKEQEAEHEAQVFEVAGGYAPTIGIIGAVMGLIQVMKTLNDLEQVGHGIAVAFVATLYGVGVANLVLLPAAGKLRARAAEETMMRELALEGVLGIIEGMNPKLIRLKLEAFLLSQPGSAKGKPSTGKVAKQAASKSAAA